MGKILSIIIPVYNVEQYVEKCIRSCAEQDIPSDDYEIIIINDGSKDNSLSIVNEVASEYGNTLVISQSNQGLSAARNAGMKASQGEYLMFVDSDDWIDADCLGEIVGKLQEDRPDCLAICSADVIGDRIIRRQEYSDETPMSGISYLKTEPPHCAPFSIWKASFLENNRLSFVDGIFHEDSEFTPRAYYFAKKVSFLNRVIYYVYQNPNSITRSINPKKSFDLVDTICLSLSEFSDNVDGKDKVIYHNLISLLLNNALANIAGSPKDVRSRLEESVYEHRDLFKHLTKSDKLKYRLEGLLFGIFPRHTLSVYQLLSLFRR